MKKSAEIKAIHGAIIKGQPDPEIVSLLERLLEKAKSGDIRALAYATHDGDDLVMFGWEHGSFFHHMVASVSMLNHAVISSRLEN
jgi:hypothetical protein